MASKALPEPWKSFLHGLDGLLPRATELHCFGGFVISELYGLPGITADVDVLQAMGTDLAELVKLAGSGSDLHKRHKVYLDVVTVASVPENYEQRLIDLARDSFENLRIRGFERHDLILAKIARNNDRDREDIRRMAEGPGLDPSTLRERYQSELRYQVAIQGREDRTLDLWIEIIQEIEERKRARASAKPA